MKKEKKDYPFLIRIEDKKSKAGNDYRSITVGYTSVKDKNAKDAKDKYETTWFNILNKDNLLKLGSLANKMYWDMVEEDNKNGKTVTSKANNQGVYEDMNDSCPF